MRALVYAACAAFVLSLAALFLPRAKKPLPGEKTPAPAWLASLTGVFMAAGAPLFALERLASGLSADPAFLPGVSFGPLPWAFAALAAAAFCLMGADKRRAIRGRWRIPERTLLLTCACFGALGGLLGMRAFRHKTLHKRFSWGVPAMLVFQATLLACLLIHYA